MATESAPKIKLSSSALEGSLKKRLSIDWAVLSPVAKAALAKASFVEAVTLPLDELEKPVAVGKLIYWTLIYSELE